MDGTFHLLFVCTLLTAVYKASFAFTHGCPSASRSFQAFKDSINNDPCMDISKVWGQLIKVYGPCRDNAARYMYEKFKDSDGSDQCTCTGKISSLNYNHMTQLTCNSHYRDLLHNSLTDPTCKTHHSIWNDLQQIPTHDEHFSHGCIDDLITTVSNAMNSAHSTCACTRNPAHADTKVSIETCRNPQTDCHYEHCTNGYQVACVDHKCTCEPAPHTESCHDPARDCQHETCNHGYRKTCESNVCTCLLETIKGNCDPVKVLTGVAHNEPVGSHTHCADHQHAQAWTFVVGACTLPHHHWYKGAKVKDICSTLPHYTAIGHFVGSRVDRNFTSSNVGVFIGCENDYFKMVTEDCQTNLHVRHVQFHDAESDEFYVIKQQQT